MSDSLIRTVRPITVKQFNNATPAEHVGHWMFTDCELARVRLSIDCHI
jgi:hypothetical protein